MQRLTLAVVCSVLVAASAVAANPAASFYIYSDKGAPENHYIPSGWMGDYGDLKFNDNLTQGCHAGKTCIEVKYSAEAKQGANWSGIYWQHPANNWGNKPGGFDLTGYKRLSFWAKGAKGGEVINEFKVGGITGEYGDTDAASIGPITLTKDWKEYKIDLSDKTLTKIVGGFCWATSRDNNPEGFSIYFDEIKFEK